VDRLEPRGAEVRLALLHRVLTRRSCDLAEALQSDRSTAAERPFLQRRRRPGEGFPMKKIFAIVGLLMLAGVAPAGTEPAERMLLVSLQTVDDSGVTGYVQLTSLPGGGTRMRVSARGLQPGRRIGAFYYANADCAGDVDLLDVFVADASGRGEASAAVEEEIDAIGSVAVRFGPEFGTLLACARLH